MAKTRKIKLATAEKRNVPALIKFFEKNLLLPDIYGSKYLFSWSDPEYYEIALNNGNVLNQIALENGAIVGACLSCLTDKPTALSSTIDIIGVDEKFRNLGLGKQFIKNVEQAGKDSERDCVYVSSFSAYKTRGFYESLGYNLDSMQNEGEEDEILNFIKKLV